MTTRTIGIVGGMSPESTSTYYLRIVRGHVSRFGDLAYPRIVVSSVSFQRLIDLQHEGRWDEIASELQLEFEAVAAAGADFAVLATNTMHKVLPLIRSPIPILPVFDAIAAEARERGYTSLGVLGTAFTMSEPFFVEGLRERGLEAIVPSPEEQTTIHRVIYDELIRGIVTDESREVGRAVARSLIERGADVALLACTELQMLEGPDGLGVPTLDTAACHADFALHYATRGQAKG